MLYMFVVGGAVDAAQWINMVPQYYIATPPACAAYIPQWPVPYPFTP